MKRVSSEALVLRVNEFFYDLIDDLYDDVHAEMAGVERGRWQGRVARHLIPTSPLTIADPGSGKHGNRSPIRRYKSILRR